MPPKPRPWEDRFWTHVDFDGPDGCWLWTGYVLWNGYGQFIWRQPGLTRFVHRIAYMLLIGPIPDGHDLDHLCRVRNCLNPWHLEPVTRRTNLLRGEHPRMVASRTGICVSGRHALSGDNVYRHRNGTKTCLSCRNERQAAKAA